MYGYRYEEDILHILRLLKFLHMQNPKVTARILAGRQEETEDDLYTLAEDILWELFDDVEFDTDEMDETTVVAFSHPLIDKFLSLSSRVSNAYFRGKISAGQRRLQDAVQYYGIGNGYSIYRLDYHFSAVAAEIMMWISPDCFNSMEIIPSLMDLLLYLQMENERMEDHLAEAAEELEDQLKEAAS